MNKTLASNHAVILSDYCNRFCANGKFLRNSTRLFVLSISGILAAAFAIPAVSQAQSFGGELVYAQKNSPPTLDPMISSSALTRMVSLNVFEMLVTRDELGDPVPDLASSIRETNSGQTYVFKLRHGVRFHNGREMTSDDVRASIERYASVGFDSSVLQLLTNIEVISRYEVALHLSRPDPLFIFRLSSPRSPLVIMPAEEAVKKQRDLKLVGTGPFRFDRWIPDAYILLRRFENYSINLSADGQNGLAGQKRAYLDSVRIKIIPERGTQLAALEAGEVHLLSDVALSSIERLQKRFPLKYHVQFPGAMYLATLNAGFGATKSIGIRRAIQAAIDCENLMALASDGVYELSHGLTYPESSYWAGNAGKTDNCQADGNLAKRLLTETAYNSEKIVIVAHTAVNAVYRSSVVLYEQLRKIGLNVELQVVDFSRALSMVRSGSGWNIWINNFGIGPWLGPMMLPRFFVGESGFHNTVDMTLDSAYGELLEAETIEGQVDALARFQERLYKQAYVVKLGDYAVLFASRANVHEFKPYIVMRFWGIWIDNGKNEPDVVKLGVN